VNPLRLVPLVVTAAMLGSMAPLSAQQPVPAPSAPPAPDTVQGYSPNSPSSNPNTAVAPESTAAPAPSTQPAPAPAAAPAQATPAQVPAPAATAAPAAAPRTVAQELGFIDVIPARDIPRIQRQLDLAKSNGREADAALATATEARSKTKGMLEVKKQEISTINARIKLADKSKQETDKITLTAEKKVNETQKAFLDRRQALHEAEIDEAKAAKRLADATTRSLELELQLAERRQTRPQGPAAEPTAVLREDAVIRELERKTLEAQQQQAQAQKDYAARNEDIAKRRLELYQAQTAAANPTTK
jgi:hypothetical protein